MPFGSARIPGRPKQLAMRSSTSSAAPNSSDIKLVPMAETLKDKPWPNTHNGLLKQISY
jgi:hypothetical protein